MRLARWLLLLPLLICSLAWGESQEARDHYNRGVIYQSQGKSEEAIAEYQQAIALDPQYGWAWSNLGNIWLSLGKAKEAIECYQQAIAVDPKDASFHNNLGYGFSRQGKLDLAVLEYEKALGLYPDYGAALFNLACLHSLSGHLDLSLSYLQQAMGKGFSDLEFIEKEPDLASLRADPRCAQLLARQREKGAPR
jgi:tetratricopeptide (TPR) repeat protein